MRRHSKKTVWEILAGNLITEARTLKHEIEWKKENMNQEQVSELIQVYRETLGILETPTQSNP